MATVLKVDQSVVVAVVDPTVATVPDQPVRYVGDRNQEKAILLKKIKRKKEKEKIVCRHPDPDLVHPKDQAVAKKDRAVPQKVNWSTKNITTIHLEKDRFQDPVVLFPELRR